MAEGKLHTRIFVDGRLIVAVRLLDGRIQETRPEWMGSPDRALLNVTLSYDSPTPTGTDDLVLDQGLENLLCLVGSNFMSWVGTNSHHALFLRDRILHGKLLPSEAIDGHGCHVVSWDNKLPNYHRRDKFYFDSETYLWRQWDTLTSDGKREPVLERRRRHRRIEIHAEVAPAEWWQLSPDGRTTGGGGERNPERTGSE